jgi:uncharacterized glyoxalase superfamily protein PhnB
MDIARHHQLHGVQPVLPVADVAAAAHWFRDTLGFEIDFIFGEPAQHGRVKVGDVSWGQPVYIHLHRSADPVRPSGELRLHVGHDLDGFAARVRAAGATLLAEPADQPWGLREFVVAGPEGHALRFCAEIDPPLPNAARCVIASFRPKPGQEAALLAVVREHVPTLRRLGLATIRPTYAMKAADGTIVEVFEWMSAEAIERAHSHPAVLAMWERFAAACSYVSLTDLAEAAHPFAEFTPL